MRYFLNILAVMILSSCSTILFTPREKVKISSNVRGFDLELNGKTVAQNIDSTYMLTLSKRKRRPAINISKAGYDPQTFTFYRTGRGAKVLDVLGLIAGGGLLITGAALLPNPIPEEAAKAQPVLAIGAALFLPSLIDVITKSPNTFTHRHVAFDLNPSTPVLEKSGESIICAGVNIQILPGTVIGSIFAPRKGRFKKAADYKWQETSNLSVEELVVLVNNEFSNAGYTVPGLKNKFNENDNHSRYILKAEIKKLDCDVYNIIGGFISDINLRSKVVWSVYDNKKRTVVLEETITSAVWGNNANIRLLVFNVLTASVKKLMNDSDFKALFTKANEKSVESKKTNTTDKIFLAQTPRPEKISDLVEATLSVDLGDGHGSGVIISNEGYILTNAHVVRGENSVNVILNSGLNLTAEVITRDEAADLALLKLPGKGYKCASINLNEVTVGTDVIAIGTPGKIELGQSVSKGIISGKREIQGNVLLQTDVSISPGNSGGPVFNSDKELIGIVTSKLIGNGIEGVGFAIPIATALKKLGIEIK